MRVALETIGMGQFWAFGKPAASDGPIRTARCLRTSEFLDGVAQRPFAAANFIITADGSARKLCPGYRHFSRPAYRRNVRHLCIHFDAILLGSKTLETNPRNWAQIIDEFISIRQRFITFDPAPGANHSNLVSFRIRLRLFENNLRLTQVIFEGERRSRRPRSLQMSMPREAESCLQIGQKTPNLKC